MYNTYIKTRNRCICCDAVFQSYGHRDYCHKCAKEIKACLPASLVLTPCERRIPENELRARIDAVIDSYNS